MTEIKTIKSYNVPLVDIECRKDMNYFIDKIYKAFGVPLKFRGVSNVIPCECNTGSMVRITDVHDDDVGKYRCTGCGITKERI